MQKLNSKSALTDRQQALLKHWTTLLAKGQIPSRRDINPGQLGVALANTSLVEREGDTFRFRLTGSRLEGLFGRRAKGRLLEEIDTNVEEAGSASMALTLETGRPVSGNRKTGTHWHCWLRVPLRDRFGNVCMVLCLDEFPKELPGEDAVYKTDNKTRSNWEAA